MIQDPIIEEIHKYREDYAKQFNYDIDAIYKDLKDKQDKSTRQIASFAAKPVK